MGNSSSRVVGCFVPFSGKNGGGGGGGDVDLEFFEPLDEGLGHSFCYVRPMIFDSPSITPSNSERFTLDSSTIDSETLSGSFRHDSIEDNQLCSQNKPNRWYPETTFKCISGASVSANVSTARTGNQGALFGSDALEPAASFESTASFEAIPLQPLPRGSARLNGFISGPLERGFASGPLERGGGFMSGPIQKGVMSGPLDVIDKSTFSAPLARSRRKPGLQRLMRSVSGPVKSTLSRTFARHSMGPGWMQRIFLHPVTHMAWHSKRAKFRADGSRNCLEEGQPEGEFTKACNLQWAHGKAGEDRVHVVLSEDQGWLFIGIYDGFSGPDAPDFLMSQLYRAIDKEMEGLLWEYDNECVDIAQQSGLPGNVEFVSELDPSKNNLADSGSNQVISKILEKPLDKQESFQNLSSNCEIVEEYNEEVPVILQTTSVPAAGLCGQGKKSMRLYELLQMESWDEPRSLSVSEDSGQSDISGQQNEGPTTSAEYRGERMDNVQSTVDSISVEQRQIRRKSLISSKIKNMYRKQKSLRKKLFSWNYDWHREPTCVEDSIEDPQGPTRRCKSGVIDHNAVLRAMSRALETTEEAYMEMVLRALDKNPELALMGSCVLVMLMKDQDVYVMNLGDSRVILAQERPNDRYPGQNGIKEDLKHRNRSRESFVHMELDRISEESPIHTQSSQANKIKKSRDISFCRLKMRALQLSTDHSTSIEEEVLRIKGEHLDDAQAVLNDRVKGQLKVTRAFGACFLKEPRCNEALLEMFQVGYVGTSPYLSCIPSVCHHRLSSSDRFLVLSSDGLYQYFSNEEVVAHVTWFIENVPEGDPAQYLIAELLFRAAKKNGMDFHELLDIPNGDRRKYHDDVSVMVVSLEGRIWRSSG